MRFPHSFTPRTNSRNGERRLAPHRRTGAQFSAQCYQPHSIVFSPRTIFLRQIARPTRCPKNLTEFPFGPNFSKPDLEVL